MNEMRIYVASLSDYNNGRLEGKWLDLADYSDASELMEAIQKMLDELTEKYKNIDGEVREEFAVHDYEGIPSTLASEYMGEQDFQQLYDIAEVADERGIPVEVLVERAGDTGSDDYQALADSLMFVVDGNDESDIVYEYESQLGNLGNDFWSNHIYIDDVTERVIYGEDVDRFREDILSENPDIDEDEAERQAEEMADEEAERREDLTTYLEDMGYGDEIPSFVSKDYQGAWKRSLSYDFDVINHDGQMYVFSSNYSLGGTILSGMIGAYIGYKIGRAKPQKKGFETEKKIGRKVKSAFTKKKMARGGSTSKSDLDILIDEINEKSGGRFYLGGAYGNYELWGKDKDGGDHRIEVGSRKDIRESLIKNRYNSKFTEYAKGGNVNTGRSWLQDRRMHNKSEGYEKPINSRKRQFAEGGGVLPTRTIGDMTYKVFKDGNGYNVSASKAGYSAWKVGKPMSKVEAVKLLNSLVDTKGKGNRFEDGGGVEGHKHVLHIDGQNWFLEKIDSTHFYMSNDHNYRGMAHHIGQHKGEPYYEEVREWLKTTYAKGGGIGFKGLSSKVAKRYEGKSVAPKYQGEYGKRYSKSEAKEVGDKVAGKVYWQQQGRKMENGGGVEGSNNFYFAWADVNYFDEEGEFKKYHTSNYIKSESKEKAKMIFLRHLENKIGQNEWEWAEEYIEINPANNIDESIKDRGYLSASDFGGLSKEKFSKGRFEQGGAISGLDDLIRG